MVKDYVIVRCPKCGYEYVASEIFYPDSLLGKPSNIIRDDNGHIVFVEGEEPNRTESFVCDKCGTAFDATLNIVATSLQNSVSDDDDFVVDLEDENVVKLF